MPIYNDIKKYTVTNAGGTENLDVTQSTVTRYVFSGTATLAAGYVIQPTGTPLEGMEFDIRWQAVVTTAGANVVTVFGTVLTTDQALNDLIITCYYNGSAWDVDIQQDGVQEVWEYGTGGVSTAKLVNGGTSTATILGAVNAGYNSTAGGQNSFIGGINNTTSGLYTTTLGNGNTASGNAAIAVGATTTASGINSFSEGNTTIASGDYSHASGLETTSSGTFSNSSGYKAVSSRYGQLSRSSGAPVGTNKLFQKVELTPWNTTTDATPTLLYLDGSGATQLISILNNSSVTFEGVITAVQLSGTAGTPGDTASWIFNGQIKNIAGTTALVDSVLYLAGAGTWGASAQRAQDAAIAAATVAVTADNGTDSLSITVTGEANKNIYWMCTLTFTEIRYTT